jgi:MFS family permease
VGIIIPCMPLLVSQLSIPASEFGLVISAFGLSKLIGNIPSGYFVEKYGRKPSMVVGLGMCGVGLGALGEWLCETVLVSWSVRCLGGLQWRNVFLIHFMKSLRA